MLDFRLSNNKNGAYETPVFDSRGDEYSTISNESGVNREEVTKYENTEHIGLNQARIEGHYQNCNNGNAELKDNGDGENNTETNNDIKSYEMCSYANEFQSTGNYENEVTIANVQTEENGYKVMIGATEGCTTEDSIVYMNELSTQE